jgi:precorrin-2 dehydrogenase/sirohydrochlorin ferrochelatase
MGLVMVATDDGEVNRSVADEARRNGILVNAADDVANCDFILPSLAKRGGLQIASSTGGGSPAMARWLRERLEEFLDDSVIDLADLLAETRVDIRAMDRECAAQCPRTKTPPPLLCEDCPNRIPVDRWQDAINGGVFDLVRQGRMDDARTLLKERLQRSELTPAPWWTEREAAEERVG